MIWSVELFFAGGSGFVSGAQSGAKDKQMRKCLKKGWVCRI
jgi:hypothetical protein